MKITIEIPDDIAEQLKEKWTDFEKETLEALLVSAYRDVLLSAGQVAEILGLNIWTVQGFLAKHQADLHYSVEDLEKDAAQVGKDFEAKQKRDLEKKRDLSNK